MIHENTKMVDLIHRNYVLITVFSRFGISLGFGDKTIQQVCEEKNINIRFFLEIINSFLDHDYFPQEQLKSFPIKLIVDYLTITHQYYLGKTIPEIEEIISGGKGICYENKEHNYLLNNFFQEYKKELITHITREDELVFPYALQVEECFLQHKSTDTLFEKYGNYSIGHYLQAHDNIEEKLFDLKNIIIKYLPPPKNPELCYQVIVLLFNLEKDMNDHSRIEEKVFVPKVSMMEKVILNKNKK